MSTESNPSQKIDKLIADLHDWRGKTLAEVRKLIHKADPKVIEEWKWMGSPVWNHDGIICVGNAHKKWVKLTFPKGASIPDPAKVFNAGLDGGTWRSINFLEGDKINEKDFVNLVRAAIKVNEARPAKPTKKLSTAKKSTVKSKKKKV